MQVMALVDDHAGRGVLPVWHLEYGLVLFHSPLHLCDVADRRDFSPPPRPRRGVALVCRHVFFFSVLFLFVFYYLFFIVPLPVLNFQDA